MEQGLFTANNVWTGADQMAPTAAILIGFIAGIIIPFSVSFFDKVKIDDPVGATSVHLVCGIWGTLAVGLFGNMARLKQLWIPFYGVAAVGAFTFVFAYVVMYALKVTMGVRVSEEEEATGLDMGEHDMHAYSLAMEESSFQLTIK